jgi:hypothetical protein
MRASALFAAAVVAVSCGPAAPEPEPPQFNVIAGTGTPGPTLPQQELDAGGTVSALGITQDGDLVVLAGELVFERVAGALTLRNLYAEAGDPTSTGAVSQIVPSSQGGAWLSAEAGLFLLQGDFVSHSPVMAGMGPLAGVSDVANGNLSGLWIAAANGVYRRQSQATNRYDVDGFSMAAAAVAVEHNGSGAFALLGNRLVLLTPGDSAPAAALPPDDVGGVKALAGTTGALFAATDRGLYRWKPSQTPAWTRFSLDGNGALDVQVDPVTGSAWVTTPGALYRIDADVVTSFSRPDGTQLLAVDQVGDLWTARGATLVQLKAGAGMTAASFANDVKPFLTTSCVMCHADFTDIGVFAPIAEDALQRVRSGDMPRCSGGVPCPADQHLTADQYAVLEGWIRGGQQP